MKKTLTLLAFLALVAIGCEETTTTSTATTPVAEKVTPTADTMVPYEEEPIATVFYFQVELEITRRAGTTKEVFLVQAGTRQEAEKKVADYFMAAKATYKVLSIQESKISFILN